MAKRFDTYDLIILLEAQILAIEPAICRTLELPRDLNFAQLHVVLQAAFGWTDSHLHQFIMGGLVVGAPDYLEEDGYGPRVLEATEVHLRDLRFPFGPDAQLEILYQYDIGDNWQHRLILSEAPPAEGVKYPRCIAGLRSCPPEDVGGDTGYEAFLEAWRDPDHEDHADYRRWAGRKFDPERFDLEAMNRAISRALRLSRGNYPAREI
jgi:hypothetical protein